MTDNVSIREALAAQSQDLKHIKEAVDTIVINDKDQWRHIRVLEDAAKEQSGAIKVIRAVGAFVLLILGWIWSKI